MTVQVKSIFGGRVAALTANIIGSMKREAKRQKKVRGISHSEALDEQAKKFGFNGWALLMKEAHKQGVQDA